jgi:hypothetical protein
MRVIGLLGWGGKPIETCLSLSWSVEYDKSRREEEPLRASFELHHTQVLEDIGVSLFTPTHLHSGSPVVLEDGTLDPVAGGLFGADGECSRRIVS